MVKDKKLGEITDLINKGEIKEARKKAMRINLKLPLELRRKFCHHCYSPIKGRIRLRKGKKVKLCDNCGKFTRIPFKTKN